MLLLAGCKGSGKEPKIVGTVNYNGVPMGEVGIEIYLKQEKDKSVPPFATSETNANGDFEITLPSGRYFVIGKKRFIEGGITKMLMGEYPKNPVDVKSDDVVKLAPFSLFNMGEDKSLDIEGSGIIGTVIKDTGDIMGTYVYVYPVSTPDLFGPS